MDFMHATRADKRARNGITMTNVAVVLPPVGHVGELHFDSEETMSV